MDGGGECEADVHAARILFHGAVDELANLRKGFDGGQISGHFGAADAHNFAVDEDVFVAGKFGVEACTEFQQGSDSAARNHTPCGGLQDAADHLEQGALAAAVGTHQTDHFASLHAE